jgi:Cof subfamily protein (haloacid dehalogenase superfamily)
MKEDFDAEEDAMAIKLIAFDMDDTLLLDDRTIGARTLRALRAAHEQGVKIVPATGRGKHSMWNYVQQIGVADAAICTNGAQVYDGAGNPIRECPVPLDLAREIVRFAQENGWYVQGYSEDDYFFAEETEETRLYARLSNHMGKAVGNLLQYMQAPPFKLLFVQTDMEKMARLKEQAFARFGKALCVFDSKPFYLEMTDHGATKGAAVRYLAERFGLLPGETMCFGDSGNDLSMIESAGVGVVMGNARAEIQAHADLIAPTNQEEGVAQVIEQYVLQG